MILKKLLPALAFAAIAGAVVPAFADAYDPSEDIGGLYGIRGEITGIMDYCFKNVAQDQNYIQSRDAWTVRNADASALIDTALGKVTVSPAEMESVKQIVEQLITTEMDTHADKKAFCDQFSGGLKGGTQQDLTALPAAVERITRVTEWLKTQP